MISGKHPLIVLALLGCCARSTVPQDLSGVATPSPEPYVAKIRQYTERHYGIRLEGRGIERHYRGEELWSEHSSRFNLETSADASYRHFSLTEDLDLIGFDRRSVKRMEGYYDRDYGVLNAMVWGGIDNPGKHAQLNGFLKTFGPNHVLMLLPGYALGISGEDQDSICVYFPADGEPTLEPADDGTMVLTSERNGVGKCTVRFGTDGEVAGYTIEKGKDDASFPLRRVGKDRVRETEYVSTRRIEVSGIEYREGLVSACKVHAMNVGDTGNSFSADCEFTFENAGPYVEETDWLLGLSLLKEKDAFAEPLRVRIYDDPNGEYLPDENGRVLKVGIRPEGRMVPAPFR